MNKMVDGKVVAMTDAEVTARNAEVAATEAEEATNGYKRKRASEYPYIGDQLDDLFHKGAFSTDMTATLQAVKDKYPKE